MTKKQKAGSKQQRKQYSTEFKDQALLRALAVGVPVAANELGLEAAQLYAWRSKANQRGQDTETQRLAQAETTRLKRELARLEEENAFLKKAAAYFAKQPK